VRAPVIAQCAGGEAGVGMQLVFLHPMTTTVQPPRARACLLAAAAALSLSSTHAQTRTLPETRVTATRFAEPLASLPLGVSVITADEIRATGATNVTEAIMRVLGVVGRQDFFGGNEYTLDLRGFGTTADNNQVVVLDGIRLSEQDLTAPRLAGIPIESIERIEVLRGSGAVLYGEGATGGVIVITTKAGAGRQPATGGTVYGAVGSNRLRDFRASATGSFGNGFSLDGNIFRRSTDGERVNSASDVRGESVTGQWGNTWLRFGARVSHDRLDARLPGALSAAQYERDPRQSTTPNDWATIRNDLASVFARADVGGWELAFDAGRRDKELRSLNVSPFGATSFDYDVEADTYGLRARKEASFGSTKNILVFGADRNEWRRQVFGRFGSAATQRSTAFYAKDDLILAGGTRLSLGARTDRIRKDNDTPPGTRIGDREHAWELGISHPFAQGWTGYARIGRSYRLANVDEFNLTTPGIDLRPQNSRDLELGTRWNYDSGNVEARLYSSRLTDEIGYDPNAIGPSSPFGFNGANINFDPTRRQGLEIDWSHKVTAALGLRANLALREATFRAGPYAGNDVPLVPRRSAAVRADFTPVAGQRLTGGVNWVSSQHPDFANRCSMPSYTTADARYAWQFHRNAELALGVTNLFDRKFYTQAFQCAAGVTNGLYPEAGRQFYVSARVQF
jgi:iron complex outermembrane receptor protein